MEKKTSFSVQLSPEQQRVLACLLSSGNYRPMSVEHTIVAAEGTDCNISLYKSGKCVVQGKGAEDFVMFVLEPEVLKEARVGYEEVLSPETYQPHMGVDESGKGDYFGPLVIAAAYVDRGLALTMQAMGVKDSKCISSDKRAVDLARGIRGLLGDRYAIVTIGPAAYNRLYARMRNVNKMLAWAHARAIENLMEKVPSCPRAISDQFGSKQQVLNALMKKGRKIELVQRHKAESDIAVAAASLLARAGFLWGLSALGRQYGIELPKGASGATQQKALDLARKHSPQTLVAAAKCHFKTTDQVLGTLGVERSVLGPDGMAKSKPGRFFHRGSSRGHGGKPADRADAEGGPGQSTDD